LAFFRQQLPMTAAIFSLTAASNPDRPCAADRDDVRFPSGGCASDSNAFFD
jgi:hypothetical protein